MKTKIILIVAILIIISLVLYLFIIKTNRADMILINGNIYTLDNTQPLAEAIAIKNGKIAAVGKTDLVLEKYQSENVVDLKGKTVVPGLIDAHAHMFGLGQMLNSLILVGMKSSAEISLLVGEKAKSLNKGEWIYGRGWDQTLWINKNFPDKYILDEVSPDNPVILGRIDGHAIWVNQKAMDIAKIDNTTPDIQGGVIIRNSDGFPTGIFIDKAAELIEKSVPAPSEDEIENSILLAAKECVKFGLTEVHDMGLNSQIIKIYKKLALEKKLPIRIYGAIEAPGAAWDAEIKNKPTLGFADDMFNLRAVKMYADGALGSRGAALVENYSDDPGNRGITIMADADMEMISKEAIQKGYQVCIHAIGDRANHIVLNLFERLNASTVKQDIRSRIEHAQVILQDDIPRFKKLNVLPSMQPIHATSDMDWVEDRLGTDRVKGAYAWKSLINSGSIIPAGSDFPNDIMQPLWGFYAAVTRTDQDGNPDGGWYPDQIMTRNEALKAYTTWAAFAGFAEKKKGTIEVGKYADITVLSNDIMTIPAKEILTTNIVMTIVNGNVVYMHR